MRQKISLQYKGTLSDPQITPNTISKLMSNRPKLADLVDGYDTSKYEYHEALDGSYVHNQLTVKPQADGYNTSKYDVLEALDGSCVRNQSTVRVNSQRPKEKKPPADGFDTSDKEYYETLTGMYVPYESQEFTLPVVGYFPKLGEK